MLKHTIRFALALAICALAFGAVSNAQKGGSTMNVAKIKKTLDKENDPTKCKGPRPADRGCKIYCKPCQVAVCEAASGNTNASNIWTANATPSRRSMEAVSASWNPVAVVPPDARNVSRNKAPLTPRSTLFGLPLDLSTTIFCKRSLSQKGAYL